VSLGVCTSLQGGAPYCLALPKNVFGIELPTAPPPNPYGERDSWELRRKKSPWPVLCAQEKFARGRENTLLPWSGQYRCGSLGQFQHPSALRTPTAKEIAGSRGERNHQAEVPLNYCKPAAHIRTRYSSLWLKISLSPLLWGACRFGLAARGNALYFVLSPLNCPLLAIRRLIHALLSILQ